MNHQLQVFKVQPAPELAGWIDNIVSPALKIICADSYPIEFRPTGAWGGWAAGSRDRNPDGRISLSNKVRFYCPSSILHLYIHELSHNILDDAEQEIEGRESLLHHHDAAFFCLNSSLLLRLDSEKYLFDTSGFSHINSMSFYDLQDSPYSSDELKSIEPENWRIVATSWAFKTAHELAPSELTAHQLGVEICRRYWDLVDSLLAAPELGIQEKEAAATVEKNRRLAAKKENERVAQLESDLNLFKCLFLILCLSFLTAVYLLF